MVKRVLVAFDFDHTLIDENSDIYILRLLPNGCSSVPASIKKLYSAKNGWNEYQREVFRYLHANHVSKEQLLSCVSEMRLVDGMSELLQYLSASKVKAEIKNGVDLANGSHTENVEQSIVNEGSRPTVIREDEGKRMDCAASAAKMTSLNCEPDALSDSEVEFDVTIISDANSAVIEHVLEQSGIKSVFSKIYTNPASFDSSGCLQLSPYQHQDWCNMSAINMCKGYVLEEHCRQTGIQYDTIAYVGDGSNDFCPTLRLRRSDVVFPRRHFTLAKRIAECRDKIPATVKSWETGFDIMDGLKEFLSC